MNIDKICEQLTIDEKIRLLGGVGDWHTYDCNGKIPSIMMTDGPHGIRKLEQEKKIAGLLETQLEEVLESYDAVVIEADGAKHYPFKVPAEHEPVIYQITTHILIVESMQAFNRPLSEVCFRLEKAQEILNQADFREKQLTPEIVAKLLEKGYLEKLTGSLSNPKRKIGVIFNQQDSQTFEEKLSVPVISSTCGGREKLPESDVL